MQHTDCFVGVDVAKASLRSCVHGRVATWEMNNDDTAITSGLAALPASAMIAVESTGRYHQRLVTLSHAAGHRVFVLNARDVYYYAKALGARGKIARTDAHVIARYLAEHHRSLRPWRSESGEFAQLREMLRCRAVVARKRESLGQALRGVVELEGALARLQRQFDELLRDIDARLRALIDKDSGLSAKSAMLRTITGVGAQGSALLCALFARVAFASADAVVAYSGLDPRANDSGTKIGRRRLAKRGTPQLRRQMYLAALAASRSKALGALYRSIKAKGFKPTQALVILARKLLRVAWAIWRTGEPFDPTLVGRPPTCVKT